MTFDRNVHIRRKNFVFGESDEDDFLIPDDIYIMAAIRNTGNSVKLAKLHYIPIINN